jgi:hypothetical protein
MWAPARRGAAQRGFAMAELQQLRVQEAVDAMVKSVEKENIRKMQVAGRGRAGTPRPRGGPLPGPFLGPARGPLPADRSWAPLGSPWRSREPAWPSGRASKAGQAGEVRAPWPCARPFPTQAGRGGS